MHSDFVSENETCYSIVGLHKMHAFLVLKQKHSEQGSAFLFSFLLPCISNLFIQTQIQLIILTCTHNYLTVRCLQQFDTKLTG